MVVALLVKAPILIVTVRVMDNNVIMIAVMVSVHMHVTVAIARTAFVILSGGAPRCEGQSCDQQACKARLRRQLQRRLIDADCPDGLEPGLKMPFTSQNDPAARIEISFSLAQRKGRGTKVLRPC
jgi:hypothetical protein